MGSSSLKFQKHHSYMRVLSILRKNALHFLFGPSHRQVRARVSPTTGRMSFSPYRRFFFFHIVSLEDNTAYHNLAVFSPPVISNTAFFGNCVGQIGLLLPPPAPPTSFLSWSNSAVFLKVYFRKEGEHPIPTLSHPFLPSSPLRPPSSVLPSLYLILHQFTPPSHPPSQACPH